MYDPNELEHKTSRNRLFFVLCTSIMLCTGLYIALRLFWFNDFSLFVKFIGISFILVLSQCMFGMRYLVSFTQHMSYTALKLSGYCSAYFVTLASLIFLHDVIYFSFCIYFQKLFPYAFSKDFTVLFLIVAFFATIFGAWNALKIPYIFRRDLFVRNLPKDLQGMKIVHLSDLHIGSTFDEKWLDKLVTKINTEQADLIVVSGDLVDATPRKIEKDLEPLRKLKSRLGVHICLGNHEYFCGALPWIEKWKSWGFYVYINENRKFFHNNFPFYIAGSADFEGYKFPGLLTPDLDKTLKDLDEKDFIILLQHQPKMARINAKLGIDIQLSGHTHGGQYFFLFPIVHILNRGFRNGFYQVGDMSLYVSPGSGLWGYVPLRFGTRSEVIVHKLVSYEK